jgi:hypothetical protein
MSKIEILKAAAPVASPSGGPAGTAAGERSAVPATPTVRHKRLGWTGDLLGYGRHLPEYRVRWHEPHGDGTTVYQVDCNDFELVQEPTDLRADLICSDILCTLRKLSADLTRLRQIEEGETP